MPKATTTVPGDSSGLWWRSKWMESIFSADDLKPLEVLVAAVYADHSRNQRVAWVTGERLMQRTKLSKDASHRALKGLETKGYLVAIERKHRRPTTYALVIPEHRLSTGDVPNESLESASRTQLVRETDSTGTGGVLHPSTYPSSSSHVSPAPTTSASTNAAIPGLCRGTDKNGDDCGQMIPLDRLHLPCVVCGTTNQPLLKDVSA